MKKILLIFALLSVLLIQPVHAATTTQVTLSDAIYADLAINHYLDNVSLYFTDGKASDGVELNETRHWLPASTVKLFTAMYAYKLIAEKKINLSDTVTITNTNEVPTELVTDDLPTLLTGDTVTIDRLIRQMLIQSDNTAFNQLLDILGRDNITTYVQSLGLTHTHIGSKLNLDESQTQYEYDVPGYGVNTTTAQDYAKAFLLIRNNKIPGAQALFITLKDQRINNMIPYYLPKTVICAHKTGDLDPLFHDGGICQDKKTSYILTIFTNAGDPNVVAHLSQIIYTRNLNLVGQNPDQETVGQITHPIDPLALAKPTRAVLGISSTNFPTPDITAADLGVKASDLSLTIPESSLPHLLIPVDSPLHGLSDAWQITKLLVAPNAKAREAVNLDIGKLRLAEAIDLAKRGKAQEAQQIFASLQQGLQTMAQNKLVQNDPIAQNTLQTISETRFHALNIVLQQSRGEQKLQLIKQIATDAKQTIQSVEPYLPDAANATNPSQKPLVGQVVHATTTEVTVKTAGGQEITMPINTTGVKVKEENNSSFLPSASSAAATSQSGQEIATSTSQTAASSRFSSLTVGTTVAVIGTNRNNVFAPTLIIAHVPRELIAPQPVVVQKVTADHIIVEENGIYTQVNVNPDTIVKAADTNIPLTQIKPGDVIVVHGDPLTQTPPPALPAPVITPSSQQLLPGKASSSVSKQLMHTPTGMPTNTITIIPTLSPFLEHVQPTIVIQQPLPNTQSLPTNQTPTPNIINSTSIQVIENKQDVAKTIQTPQPKGQSQPKDQQTKPQVTDQKIPPTPEVKK